MSTGHPDGQENRQMNQKISSAEQRAPDRAPVQKMLTLGVEAGIGYNGGVWERCCGR